MCLRLADLYTGCGCRLTSSRVVYCDAPRVHASQGGGGVSGFCSNVREGDQTHDRRENRICESCVRMIEESVRALFRRTGLGGR